MGANGTCYVCYESQPPPIKSGCACRDEAGFVHIGCMVQVAVSQVGHRGVKHSLIAWSECQTCKQDFTGAMRTGLAEAWWARVRDAAEESSERQAAAYNLGKSLIGEGKYGEADRMLREMHGIWMRVLGAEHPHTLTCAHDIAFCLLHQGKHAEAEQIHREVLAARKRVLGPEHLHTLSSAANLATSHLYQGKHAEAELMFREVLAVQKRVLEPEHRHTLNSATNLASSLIGHGKDAEAEQIYREVVAVQKRVLGPEHPDTIGSAASLAIFLLAQDKYTEAQLLFEATLEVARRVLGPAHPNTVALHTASLLHEMRSHLRAAQPAAAASNATRGAARPPPAGTRVLVQRLVAKPEHNGKRARVVSFDARSGRYCEALDDGRELSFKAECVARAGCAAAGCASEEASSVCARCRAVRYCSRECQRADWRAHKPACVVAHTG
jgi:tetratricopeptide (TPR) repeat protein